MTTPNGTPSRLLMIWRLALLVLQEAWHGRYFLLIGAEVLAAVLLAALFGESALTEGVQIRVGTLAALLRFGVILSLALFAISSMARELSDGITLIHLSLPVSRATYLLGRFFGLALVSLLTVTGVTVLLLFVALPGVALAWSCSLLLEGLIVAAFALLCAISLRQIPQAFAATTGFYLLARSVSTFEAIAAQQAQQGGDVSDLLAQYFLDALAHILPSLDRFTSSAWLMSGHVDVGLLGQLTIQATVYLLLLFAVALFDLQRKNF